MDGNNGKATISNIRNPTLILMSRVIGYVQLICSFLAACQGSFFMWDIAQFTYHKTNSVGLDKTILWFIALVALFYSVGKSILSSSQLIKATNPGQDVDEAIKLTSSWLHKIFIIVLSLHAFWMYSTFLEKEVGRKRMDFVGWCEVVCSEDICFIRSAPWAACQFVKEQNGTFTLRGQVNPMGEPIGDNILTIYVMGGLSLLYFALSFNYVFAIFLPLVICIKIVLDYRSELKALVMQKPVEVVVDDQPGGKIKEDNLVICPL